MSHVPDLIPVLLQFRLIARVEELLGLDEDAVLEAATPEHKAGVNMRVLAQNCL